MPEGQLSLAHKERLCDALLAIPSLLDPHHRDACVAALKQRLGAPLTVRRHESPRHDLWLLLTACESWPGTLPVLGAVIRDLHGESAATLELEHAFSDGPFPVPRTGQPVYRADDHALLARHQREELVDLMAGVPKSKMAAAYRDAFSRQPPDLHHVWTDAGAIVRHLETSAPTEDALPLLLTFVDRLAHQVDNQIKLEMHKWVDATGTGAGLSQEWIRDLCSLSGQPSSSTDPFRDALGATGVSTDLIQSEEDTLSRLSVNPGAIALVPVLNQSSTDLAVGRRVWGPVPLRNPDFTGRDLLLKRLRDALVSRSKVSVLPQALHGQGGVGKTQLAIEYVYRFGTEYNIVWWISSEQPSLVRSSLASLAERLDLPISEDMQQTVNTLLSALAESSLHWLIVYDNAVQPDDVVPLVPSAGGHVIITSRNQTWATSRIGDPIEVDVFHRQESVELLLKSSNEMSTEEADLLADKLGDLPLALEQAAKWCEASGMATRQYMSLLEDHARELLSEGKPASYSASLYASLRLAVDGLREESPAAAELLELFSYLGAEPLATALLEWGAPANPDSPLGQAQRNPIALRKAIRDLRKYGLARVDPSGQSIQVHRLIQLILRESLAPDLRDLCKRNVQHLLASATPTDRVGEKDWPIFAAIVPHVLAADLIHAADHSARATIVMHLRYLQARGDYEASRELGELARDAWISPPDEGGLGQDHELTLKATWRLASALRVLGETDRARTLIEEAVKRMRAHLGEHHETTLLATNSLAAVLRVQGEYQRALSLDEANFEAHRQLFGDVDDYTLLVQNNVAVNYRILGDFQRALEIDSGLVATRESVFGSNHNRTAFAISNLARDLYGVGRYREALDMQRAALPAAMERLGPLHADVLLAVRTVAVALRKTGQYEEALQQSNANFLAYQGRFGPQHLNTLAAALSYAQCLRVVGRTAEACELAVDAERDHTNQLGDQHPLTLTARVNLAIMLRATGEYRRAFRLDSDTVASFRDVLGERHPYALCAASGLATDLVLQHELDQANTLSQRTLALSRKVRGDDHPYTLACAVNAAFDLQGAGQRSAGQELFDRSVEALRRTLGADHPEVLDVSRGKRAECDIEPPPM